METHRPFQKLHHWATLVTQPLPVNLTFPMCPPCFPDISLVLSIAHDQSAWHTSVGRERETVTPGLQTNTKLRWPPYTNELHFFMWPRPCVYLHTCPACKYKYTITHYRTLQLIKKYILWMVGGWIISHEQKPDCYGYLPAFHAHASMIFCCLFFSELSFGINLTN